MTSTTCLQAAQSPDQTLVAIVPPTSSLSSSTGRVLVQVYQVTSSSSQLQLTLTHTPTAPLQELLFCGNSAVVARFGTSQIVLWDLDRGVVGQIIESRDEEQFLGLATTTANECFYSLTKYGTKLVVQEYNRSTGKLVRKIKSGRWEGQEDGAPMVHLCVAATHVVVQTGPGMLRVMNTQTGKKVGKVKAGGVAVTTMKLVVNRKDETTLVTTQSGGTIVLYNTSTCEEVTRIPHPVTSSSALSDGLVQFHHDTLLVENTIFSKEGGNLEKQTTFQSIHPIAPFLTQDGRIMVMVHHKRTGCQSHFIELTDTVPEIMDLDKLQQQQEATETTKANEPTTEKAQKRKSTEPMVLGPGQAGIEVAPPTKKSKVADEGAENDEADDDKEPSTKDITIAERLQQLTNALDDEEDDEDNVGEEVSGSVAAVSTKPSFKPHRATTETLKELLTQALQASDDSLLELALGVADVKVISTTLKDIGSAHIVTLLSKLTTRLASNPMRAEALSRWLSLCLKYGKFQPHHLGPLRNLLYERTESFSDLLRLEGRLALMCDVE